MSTLMKTKLIIAFLIYIVAGFLANEWNPMMWHWALKLIVIILGIRLITFDG